MALAALQQCLVAGGGAFVIDMDLSKYFDTVPHAKLMDFLRLTVKDPVILHAIWSFLNAGTLVPGSRHGDLVLGKGHRGTPQGGVISPLLANIYLHYVLDDYLAHEVAPGTPGGVHFFRYADDVVCLVEEMDIAIQVLDLVTKRVGEFGLQLNMQKTKILDCRRPDRIVGDASSDGRICKFLGYEMLWERTQDGGWKLAARPAEGKVEAALQKTVANIRKMASSGQTAGRIRHSAYSAYVGFSNYYSSEGCQERTEHLAYEIRKFLDCIRCAGDFDVVDANSFDSVDWP